MAAFSLEDLQRLVRMQLGLRTVKASDRLVEDLGAESADVANIVAAAEERYGVEIKESEIAHLRTISDLFELIRTRRGY